MCIQLISDSEQQRKDNVGAKPRCPQEATEAPKELPRSRGSWAGLKPARVSSCQAGTPVYGTLLLSPYSEFYTIASNRNQGGKTTCPKILALLPGTLGHAQFSRKGRFIRFGANFLAVPLRNDFKPPPLTGDHGGRLCPLALCKLRRHLEHRAVATCAASKAGGAVQQASYVN